MKRFLAILLMLLLPVQMSLAAVRAIEMASSAASMQDTEICHHQGSTEDVSPGNGFMPGNGQTGHGNCDTCHYSCCSALPIRAIAVPPFSATQIPASLNEAQPPMPPSVRPERPNWADLA